MKWTKAIVGLAALTCANIAMAEVKLVFPDTVDIIVANEYGVNMKSGGLFSSTKSVTLPDGVNQIVFRFTPYFEQGNDRVKVPSEPIVAKFDAYDTELAFQLPKYRDARQAEANIDTMEWALVDEGGTSIQIVEDKLIKHGFQMSRDLQREIQDYNRQGNGVAVLATATATTAAVDSAMKPGSESGASDGSTAEEMLHFWYEKADEETKARFKEYVNKK